MPGRIGALLILVAVGVAAERHMWLSIEELISLGVSRRTVFAKIARGDWRDREAQQRGRNGKPIREVSLDSLPHEMQQRWAQISRSDGEPKAAIDAPRETPAGADVTALLSRYEPELREAFVAELHRLNRIMDAYEQINPKRVRTDAGELVFAPAVVALCGEAVCTDEVILAREPKRGKQPSPFTLDGWSRRRRIEGLAAFLRAQPTPAKRVDKRRAEITPAAWEWINANWRNYPTVSHFYQNLVKRARKQRWSIPSESTLRRFYAEIPEVVRAATFGTGKAYTSKHKPYVPRTVADLAALQVLCGDHHVLDVFCWSERRRELVRLWLTIWQCLRTGLIWGWHLDYTPSSHTIACAYANGVRAFGAQPFARPTDGFHPYIYTDNGQDYRSRNVRGEVVVHKQAARVDGGLELLLSEQGVGLTSDADVRQLLARGYNGREKPVERTFRDLADRVENEFLREGWCGRSTLDKPDAYKVLYLRHQKAVKRGDASPFPSEERVRAAVESWIYDYNTTAHERTTLGGRAVVPVTEYDALYTTRYEIPDAKLALLLMKSAQSALGKNGVTLFGATYTHPALSEFKGRKGADGKALRLEVRYTDEDYSTVWIVLPDGRICEGERLDRSSILNPNKETQATVARLTKHEANLIRDFQLLTASRLRGESVEDRAALLLPESQLAQAEVAQADDLPIAVGAENASHATVRRIDRLDGKRLPAPRPRRVSAQEVGNAPDAELASAPDRARVTEFDFDE